MNVCAMNGIYDEHTYYRLKPKIPRVHFLVPSIPDMGDNNGRSGSQRMANVILQQFRVNIYNRFQIGLVLKITESKL